jgi:hypothetical protein
LSFEANAMIVLIASPSDTAEERAAVSEAIGKWNVSRGERERTVLVPWLYEQHAIPRLGAAAQTIINSQALERSDIVVALFDARLGTATSDAVSGTAEEIIKAEKAGKPVHVYFSTEDVPRDQLDPEQLVALKSFREELSARGLLGAYSSPHDLALKVQQALDMDVSLAAPPPAAQTPAELPTVRWRMNHTRGDTYQVENIGSAIAHGVEISAFDDLHVVDAPEEPEEVPPGEALTFMALVTMGTQDRRVRVTWNEGDSKDQNLWKYPLPYRS